MKRPDSTVQEVPLQNGAGQAKDVLARAGDYSVLLTFSGLAAPDQPVTIVGQRAFHFDGAIRPAEDPYQLGQISGLGDHVAVDVTLSGLSIHPNTEIVLMAWGVHAVTGQAPDLLADMVRVRTCGTASSDEQVATCRVDLDIATDLPAGAYEVAVTFGVRNQATPAEIVRLRFERPTPFVKLKVSPPEVAMLTPDRTTIVFPAEWPVDHYAGSAQTPRAVVQSIRNTDTQTAVQPGLITTEFVQGSQPGLGSLVLQEAAGSAGLTPGSYAVVVRPVVNSPLQVEPAELAMPLFQKPPAQLSMTLSTVTTEAWGSPMLASLPWIGSVFYSTKSGVSTRFTASNFYGVPVLTAPTLLRLDRDGQAVDATALNTTWDLVTPEVDGPQRYRDTLLVQVTREIEEGVYEAYLGPSSPYQIAGDQVIRLRVLSWPTLLMTRVLPVVLLCFGALILFLYVWRRNDRTFTGRLLLAGRDLPLGGHGPGDLEIAVEDGELVLRPATPDAQVLVRCLSRISIELRFMDPQPERIESIRLKRGRSRSSLPNRYGTLIYV